MSSKFYKNYLYTFLLPSQHFLFYIIFSRIMYFIASGLDYYIIPKYRLQCLELMFLSHLRSLVVHVISHIKFFFTIYSAAFDYFQLDWCLFYYSHRVSLFIRRGNISQLFNWIFFIKGKSSLAEAWESIIERFLRL